MPSKQPNPLHIFKPGKWTTMAGEVIEFSQADLEATAAAYSPSVSKAPLVIGHPKADDPAQGWAASLVATARGLFATPAQVDPAFAESVRTGRYGAVSSKFYRPSDAANPVPGVWYLRHIGFLGAANPAVKGLDDPEFAGADDGCVCFQEFVEFSEWGDVDNAGLWRTLRDWVIGKFGQDEADKAIPGYQVTSIQQDAQDELRNAQAATASASPSGFPAFSEPQPKESTVTEEQAAQLRSENAAAAARIATLESAATALRLQAVHAANVAFCEGLQGVAPAHHAVVLATLDHLDAQTTAVEFGEGDAKAPLGDGLKAMLKALPPVVSFDEHATKDRVGDTVDFADAQSISDAATAYQTDANAKGQNITHAQAVAAVTANRK